MCVGACCCIHDDSEVRGSELKEEGFCSNMSELSTSADSSDERSTDGFNSFFSSLSCGGDGSALSVDAETIDVPNPVPRSWHEHTEEEIESPVQAAGPNRFGVAVSSRLRLAEIHPSETFLGPELGPMSRCESSQHLAKPLHKEHETDSSDNSDGTAMVSGTPMLSSNLSCQSLRTDGLGEVASGDELGFPCL